MTESRRAGETAEELARTLRARVRNAAVAVLREGLEEVDERYGRGVADEVAGLIDAAEVFAGLADREVPARGSREGRVSREGRGRREDDDEPWEFKPLTSL
ncbi:hypothetical protein QRX50_37860 [Amycolatopsis carbonis]|uniref:Uncharacterized protein n=1 Tax=Amycolatopsis carbonis TaxID=715471 RepID=A0A9Y2IEY0_9PSEU|nr:hypothetical protein [Amycolatopsis sp. 2-15]WIX77128.1 hypothetical protein QRX50_37860 [Amycolatopsis sp. 2-15]